MAASVVISMRPDRKVAVLEHVQIHQRMIRVEFPPDETAKKETTETKVNQRTQMALNQSASWPLSRTICMVPSQTASRAKPT